MSLLDKEAVRAANRLEDMIPALTGDAIARNGGRELLMRCPFHKDTHPSMRINADKQVWRCDPCNIGGDVFEFVQRHRRLTFPEALAWLADRAGLSNGNGQGTTTVAAKAAIVQTYDYTDEAGTLLYQTVRFEPKDFRQRRPDGHGRWAWNMDGVRHVPYRLPALTGKPACLAVEGEKDVDRLWAIGVAATCNVGGAGKWRDEYARALKHVGVERIVVSPDNDDAGRMHAEAVARSCHEAGLTVRVLELPDLPPKGDVSDYLATHTKDDLRAQLVALTNGPAYVPPPVVASPPSLPPAPTVRPSKKAKDTAGRTLKLEDPDPWPDPVSGEQVLADLTTLLTAFVVFVDPGHADALALWIVHTFSMEAWWISPLAVVNSPTMRCGKSTALQLVAHLASRALPASNISPAALFRAIERYHPTLMLDEAETFLKDNEELRGLVNAGHTRKTAVVIRTVGEQHDAAVFSTWCPKFIALIGRLPATLMDRALVIPMRRKMAGERVERLRLDRLDARCLPLRRQMVRWAADHAVALREADPAVPATLDDRAADNWRPLLAVADAVGPSWADRARRAAQQVSGSRESAEESSALALLRDTRAVFDELEDTVTEVTSAQLVEQLNTLQDRPWADHRHGKGITPAWFASRMKEFDVVPGGPYWFVIDGQAKQARGYRRANFADAWNRYLGGAQTVTCNNVNNDGPKPPFQGVTDENPRYTLKTAVEPITTGLCYGVTVSEPGEAEDTAVRDAGPSERATPSCCEGGSLQVRCKLCPTSPTYWQRQDAGAVPQ